VSEEHVREFILAVGDLLQDDLLIGLIESVDKVRKGDELVVEVHFGIVRGTSDELEDSGEERESHI
jgi:hypothetical protein